MTLLIKASYLNVLIKSKESILYRPVEDLSKYVCLSFSVLFFSYVLLSSFYEAQPKRLAMRFIMHS